MSKKLRLVFILALTVICVWIYVAHLKDFTIDDLRNQIASYGHYAPLAYIILWVILPTFFFPVPVLALAGGVSFGLWSGTVYTVIGAMLNSSFMFLLARYLGGDMITDLLERKLSDRGKRLMQRMDRREGLALLFVLRLVPIIPYNLINYASGLTPIRFRRYNLATLAGIIPGTLAFLNIGDKMGDWKSPEFLLSIGFLALLVLLSVIIMKVMYRFEEKEDVSDDDPLKSDCEPSAGKKR